MRATTLAIVLACAAAGCSGANGNGLGNGGGGGTGGGVGGIGGNGGNGGGGGGGSGGSGGNGGSGGSGGSGGGGSGGSDGGSGSNVVPVIVDNGPNNIGSQDVPFISVTICVPGTSNCATIDHVSVDTGSTGLRIIASALPSGFSLPQQMTAGKPEAECFTFADGFVWGSVRLADLQLGGERAANMQLQLIGDPAFPTIPSSCSATGMAEDTVADFGGNGIIGINQWLTDCGSECTTVTANTGGYYSCSGATCTNVAMPVANQLANPVSLFAKDNNGAILTFPTVAAGGAATLAGTLTFGIGTQANNGMGSAKTYTVDADGNLGTTFNGKSLAQSFIDSGTNSYSFNDSSLTQCKGNDAGWYCPTATASLTATITGQNGTTASISFSVANTDTLFSNMTLTAFDDLAGTGDSMSFDWGFPFFIGRTVLVGFAGASSPGGNGYVAF
jgi:hypothetical protein